MDGVPLARFLGIEVVRAEPGRNICRMPVDARHLNPNGVVLGAALVVLADVSMGIACQSACGLGQTCASVEAKTSFLDSAQAGARIYCETTTLKKGSRLAFLESTLRTEEGRTLARVSSTFVMLPEHLPLGFSNIQDTQISQISQITEESV